MKRSLIILLLLSSSLYGQERILLSAAPGMNLYNSENSMKTIGDKSVGWFPGFSLAYERENMLGLNWHFEYNYSHARVDDILTFVRTTSSGPTPVGTFGADLVLSIHSIDAGVFFKEFEWLSFGGGPTFSLINRTIEMNGLQGTEVQGTRDFEDRLASYGAGLNGSISVEIPFDNATPGFLFYSTLKARYVHSLWFDKRGRDLANYYQSFFIGQWNIGLGYNF